MRDFRIIIHADQSTALRVLPILCSGICAGHFLPSFVVTSLSLLFILGAILFLVISYSGFIDWKTKLRISSFRSPVVFIGILALGYASLNISQESRNCKLGSLDGQHFAIEISTIPKSNDRSISSYGYVKASNQKRDINKKVLIKLPIDDIPPEPGDHLLVNTRPKPINHPRIPDGFNYKRYLRKLDVESQFILKDSTNYKIKRNKSLLHLDRFRLYQLQQLRQVLSPENSALAAALLLGSKGDLSKNQKATFQAAGAMHVLAVSGMHVGVVYLMLLTICRFGFRIFKSKSILLIPVIGVWGFACISGLGSPVLRASIVISLIEIGKRFRLSYVNLNLVAGSAICLLILKPHYLFELGFLLSYAAVFGIITIFPKIENLLDFKYSIANKIWSITSLSIAAQIATLPLILYSFHKFPIYSLLSNLFLVPLTALLIPIGLIGLSFLNLGLPHELLFNGINKLFRITYVLLEKVAHLSNSTIQIENFHIELLITYYLILIIAVYFLSNDKTPSLKTVLYVVFSSITILGLGSSARTFSNSSFIFQDYSNQLILQSKVGSNIQSDTLSHSLFSYEPHRGAVILNASHKDFRWPQTGCLHPQFLWINNEISWKESQYLQYLNPEMVIIGTQTDYKSRRTINNWCEKNSIPIHNIYLDGFIDLKED